MTQQKTLQTMDGNEFLGKVDELFEWLARQAGEGPIENWTLNGIQAEVRRRIMERHAAVVIEPEPEKVKIAVKPIILQSGPRIRPSAQMTIYDVALHNSRLSWDERCESATELRKFLRGVEAAASFGLAIERVHDVLP